jgi:hypothetical protein
MNDTGVMKCSLVGCEPSSSMGRMRVCGAERRLSQSATSAHSANAASPPTTPPAIALVCSFFSAGVAVGDVVAAPAWSGSAFADVDVAEPG